MKNMIALLLCLLMVASMAACGGQTSAPAEQTVTAAPTTEATVQIVETEAVETEPVEIEPLETEPAFDASWAGDAYVMPVPAPPVATFEVAEGGSRNGGVALQITATEVQDLTNDAVAAYRQTLEDLGYVNNIYERDFDSDHGYEFSAQNEEGNTVYITFNGKYFVMMFEFAA